MKKFMTIGAIAILVSCNSPSDKSDSTNSNKESTSDIATVIISPDDNQEVNFLESILGVYVQVNYEINGNDTVFYICSDGTPTQSYMKDPENENKYLSEYVGLQDYWEGLLLSGLKTNEGFELKEACKEYPECDITVVQYTYYRDGFMDERGTYYVAKEKADQYPEKHCGLYDEEQYN